MTSPKAVLKSVGPKLVPFFKTVSIFFVLYHDGNPVSIIAAIVKCLPIISLILFVLLHGMDLSEDYAYSRRIIIGLVFSCIGDALLVFKHQFFLHGMGMFALAQALYMTAFGFRPLKLLLGIICVSVGLVIYLLILPWLNETMKAAIAIYGLLIMGMVWRALSRISWIDLKEDLWTWTKMCSCGGACLFLLSDTMIAVDSFAFPVPQSQLVIMVTYYAAQLGITLSVVDSQADARKERIMRAKVN